MNTTNAAVGTGAIAVIGQWSEGKGVSVRIVVGVLFLAVILSVLPEKIATAVSWLVLTAVTFRYAPGILGKTGLTSSTPRSNAGPDIYDQGSASV